MSAYKNDPPTIIEHTTVNPTVERTTIIERDSWYAEPWAIALVIGAIAVIGLIAYWALYNPAPTVVHNTTIERPSTDRAQTITPAPAPNVIVNPAPSSPTINVNPPASSSNASSPSGGNSGNSNSTQDSSGSSSSSPDGSNNSGNSTNPNQNGGQ